MDDAQPITHIHYNTSSEDNSYNSANEDNTIIETEEEDLPEAAWAMSGAITWDPEAISKAISKCQFAEVKAVNKPEDEPLSIYSSTELIQRQQQQREALNQYFEEMCRDIRNTSPLLTPTCLKEMGLVGGNKKHTKLRCQLIQYRHVMGKYDVTSEDESVDLLCLPPSSWLVADYQPIAECCLVREEDCMCEYTPPTTPPKNPKQIQEYVTDEDEVPQSPPHIDQPDMSTPVKQTQKPQLMITPIKANSPNPSIPQSPQSPGMSTPTQNPSIPQSPQSPASDITPQKRAKRPQLKITPIKIRSPTPIPKRKRPVYTSDSDDDFEMPIIRRSKRRKLKTWEQTVLKPKIKVDDYNQGQEIPRAPRPPETADTEMVLMTGIYDELCTPRDLQGLIPQCFKYMPTPADGDCMFHALAKSTQLTTPQTTEQIKTDIINHHLECYRHTSQMNKQAAHAKAEYLKPNGTWGDEFDVDCYSHHTDHVTYCHNRDADMWQVHNPTGTRPLFLTYSNLHFSSLWPLTPRVNLQWLQRVLRDMVINPPKEWPPLQPRGTLMKYRSTTKKPVCPVTPLNPQQAILDHSTSILWPHGEQKIIDAINSEEAETLTKTLQIVNVTLRNFFQHNQEETGIKIAYGINLTTLGGTMGTIEYLKRCIFVQRSRQPTLQVTQLYHHITTKHHIKVHQVDKMSPEALKKAMHTPYPEFTLQHLYQCGSEEEIKEKFATTKQPFERVKIDSLGFEEEWMYLVKNPGSEIILKRAEVTHRKPGQQMEYYPSTWHYLVSQWANTHLDPMESLLNGTLDPKMYTEAKLPPMIPFYAKTVTDDVLSLYREDLDTMLDQLNPHQLHQVYREPYSIRASAMLYKAMTEGDKALHTTLGPIIPHMSFSIADVGEWTARGVPTILAPKPLAEATKDLILFTSRPQGSMKASPCTRAFNPLLETAITRAMAENPGLVFCCPFITVTQPTTMSILETWARAYIGCYKQQEAYETLIKTIGAIPIHCTCTVEAHYGNRDTPLEHQQKEEEKSKEDPETITTKQRKAEPIPAFQAAAEHMAKGEQVPSRKSCSGAAHLHMSWCFLCEPAKVPNTTGYLQHFTQWAHASHVKVQMCIRQYREKSKKTSTAQPDARMQQIPNATSQLSYCVKDATHKRAWRALQMLGSPHAVSTCKIAVYHQYLTPLAQQAAKHSLPVWVQLCNNPISTTLQTA